MIWAAVARAHLWLVRRESAQVLGARPVFPVLHRRRVLPARLPARALGPRALAQAARRRSGAVGRDPAGSARGRRVRNQDLKRVTVDITVQPKAITFPIEAKLLHAAIKGLNRLARRHGVRQSYACVAKAASIMASRYAHAKQFRRYQRQLRILRSPLDRIIRGIRRKIEGQDALEEAFALPLGRARQIPLATAAPARLEALFLPCPGGGMHWQGQGRRALRVRGEGFHRHQQPPGPGGLFVLHARAMPDNPYDDHTLREVIDRTETLAGCAIERAYVHKGYRGHDAQSPRRVFVSGQKRGVFSVIKRELRRRSAIEPIIGHLKVEGHLGRCYLKGRAGDAANVILSAVGYNFRRILARLDILWSLIQTALMAAISGCSALSPAS